MNDRLTYVNSNPVVETLVGSGAPITGNGLSVFRLTVDPENCTYAISATPWLRVLHTTPPTMQQVDIPAGGFHVVHSVPSSWKRGDFFLDESFDAHFVGALDRDVNGKSTYYPYGFGQRLWGTNTVSLSRGAAVVSYGLTPQ